VRRFDSTRGAEWFVDPLPPLLAASLAETPAAQAHARAVEAFTSAGTAITRAQRTVEQAREQDAQAERRAVENQRPLSKSKAKPAELALAEAERRRSIAAAVVRDRANELIAAAEPVLDEAIAAADEACDSALAEAERLLREAQEAVGRAQVAEAEHNWLRSVVFGQGSLLPFNPAVGSGRLAAAAVGAVDHALFELPQARQERRELWKTVDEDRRYSEDFEKAARAEREHRRIEREREKAEQAEREQAATSRAS
jgi:ElaB/YqjD/DUF883 family membrane-anchored ribosome-binding protein